MGFYGNNMRGQLFNYLLQSLEAAIEKARSPQMAEADIGTVRRHLELDLTLWTGLLCS